MLVACWLPDALPYFLVFRSKRVDRVFLTAHDEYLGAVALRGHTRVGTIPTSLSLTSLCDPPLLFVYFQVNTDVLYCLDCVEDIYDGWWPSLSLFQS